MTPITLTRFNVNPRSYTKQDSYQACWHTDDDDNCPGIGAYLSGLITQMSKFHDEPAAWSFSSWKNLKNTNNTLDNWISASAIVLEYRAKDPAKVAANLYTKAVQYGYAHILMESMNRKGETTVSIIFPLAENVNKDQYARLAAVLSEELGQYRAAEGNMAVSHLIHVDKNCAAFCIEGAVIAPRQKIKETEKLYQNMDPHRFTASGPQDAVHVGAPIVTHDGLFEWAETEQEKAQRRTAELMSSMGLDSRDF